MKKFIFAALCSFISCFANEETISQEEVLKKVDTNPLRMNVVYIGSEGAAYEKAYPLFLEYINAMEDAYRYLFNSDEEKVNVFVQTTEGNFEKENSPKHFLIDQVSIEEAVSVADMVICYDSAVGFQALLLGKHVCYFIPEEDPLTNIAIEMGLAPKISSSFDFDKTFSKRVLPQEYIKSILETVK